MSFLKAQSECSLRFIAVQHGFPIAGTACFRSTCSRHTVLCRTTLMKPTSARRMFVIPVGGEILVKQELESETDHGNVAAKHDKQARWALPTVRRRIVRVSCHGGRGERDEHYNSLCIRSACAPGLQHSKRIHDQDTHDGKLFPQPFGHGTNRIVPMSRSTNGWETGAYGTDLISSTSITRRLASQRRKKSGS